MKLSNFANCPLGSVDPYVPQKREWIDAVIGAGAGLASSLIGGLFGSSAAKAALNRQKEQEAKENAYYLRRYNEDFLDTSAGQNLMRRAKDAMDRHIKQAQGAKAVAGGTDAAVAQSKEQAARIIGDTAANIAANDTARKYRADRDHMQAQQRFAEMDMNREMQRSQSIADAASQASNAILSAGAAIGSASSQAPKANTPDLEKTGDNNSKVVTPPAQQTKTQSSGSSSSSDAGNKVAGSNGVTEEDYAENYELYGS